jgi:hypothetical protein
MNCSHCHATLSTLIPFDRSLEGGRAYASACPACGHILEIRSRTENDPPIVPTDLDSDQVARLTFVRWRLKDEADAQIDAARRFPPSAA